MLPGCMTGALDAVESAPSLPQAKVGWTALHRVEVPSLGSVPNSPALTGHQRPRILFKQKVLSRKGVLEYSQTGQREGRLKGGAASRRAGHQGARYESARQEHKRDTQTEKR